MRKLIVVLSLILMSVTSHAQQEDIPELKAHFSAIIVTEIDSSIVWYTKMLGFEIINKREFAEAGFKQSNLKRGTILLELIELDSALEPKKVIANYSSKTRMTGLFKIGFLVSDFDRLIQHLKENNAKFHGNIVVDEKTGKRMVIIKDPDENRIQLFEN
ncbi:VOC family protein [Psychroserpens luteolus]|uniref:VOC family protein n=1 Tax=Psychroserpens luteolus TaxID=2855840 RepID=UPI001E56662E|nr:VOC family protein [Psychroserpens luteolus]MCD2258135.1 VOC family protein [Psychroserpens luteolus]